jgi:hypothetical protein
MREEPVDACCVTTGGKLRYRYIGRVLHSYPYNSLFAALSCSCSRAYGEPAQHPEACGQAFCGSRSTESSCCVTQLSAVSPVRLVVCMLVSAVSQGRR